MAVAVPASSAVTPRSTTFVSLKRRVASFVQLANDTDALQQAGDAINSGIDVINAEFWQKRLQSYQDITTVADQSDYELNANFKDSVVCEVIDSNSKRYQILNYKESRTFNREHQNDQSAGDPSVYTILFDSRELRLNSAPSASWVAAYPTLRLRYSKRIAYLASDSERLDADPEFGTLIFWYASIVVASSLGDIPAANRAKEMYGDMWMRLRRDDHNTMTDWER